MKRIIICTILALACIAAVVLSFVFQNNLVFAEEHYENTYIDPDEIEGVAGTLTYLKGYYGYGCAENSCEYCNGSQYKKNIEDFAYYTTNSTYVLTSQVFAILCGGVFVITCLALTVKTFKAKNKTEENK